MNGTSTITKPLTPRILETLMDCHERELMNLEPCNAGTVHYASRLIVREFCAYRGEAGWRK